MRWKVGILELVKRCEWFTSVRGLDLEEYTLLHDAHISALEYTTSLDFVAPFLCARIAKKVARTPVELRLPEPTSP